VAQAGLELIILSVESDEKLAIKPTVSSQLCGR
jgi:hypothetical protein